MQQRQKGAEKTFVAKTIMDPIDEALIDGLPETIMNQIFYTGGYLTATEAYNFVSCTKNVSLKQKLEQDEIMWKQYLLEECLPGENFHDFNLHMIQWYTYQKELKNRLLSYCRSKKTPNDNKKEEHCCQDYIKKWISNYTKRVASAHSWYKHLPSEVGLVKFEFTLDLSSNMRKVNNKYIPYEENDGTRFHYTWSTTERYRELFGYFNFYWIDYRRLNNTTTSQEMPTLRKQVFWNGKCGSGAETIFVPKSYQVNPVDVSRAIHYYSQSPQQRERELFAIVMTLFELSLKTYGQELTPTWESVLEYYRKRKQFRY